MGFVQSLSATYEGLKASGRLLGSIPSNPLYTAIGGSKKIFIKQLRNSSNSYEIQTADGSITPVDFYIAPPSNETWFVTRWMIQIIDTKGFDVTNFASLSTPLTNGLDCLIESNGVQTSFLDHTIKSNSDISALAYDTRLDTYGNADDVFHTRWTLSKTGKAVQLNGSTNDKLIVKVQDDLTAITRIHINAQGYIK